MGDQREKTIWARGNRKGAWNVGPWDKLDHNDDKMSLACALCLEVVVVVGRLKNNNNKN